MHGFVGPGRFQNWPLNSLMSGPLGELSFKKVLASGFMCLAQPDVQKISHDNVWLLSSGEADRREYQITFMCPPGLAVSKMRPSRVMSGRSGGGILKSAGNRAMCSLRAVF